MKPPSMILEDDINGFKAANRKRPGEGGGGGRKKKKVGVVSAASISLIFYLEQARACCADMGSYGTLRPTAAQRLQRIQALENQGTH